MINCVKNVQIRYLDKKHEFLFSYRTTFQIPVCDVTGHWASQNQDDVMNNLQEGCFCRIFNASSFQMK
jgi:hypothetical protein